MSSKKDGASGSKYETDQSGSMTVEGLRQYLADKFGINDEKDDSEQVKVLEEASIDGIVEYIKTKNCKNIITMAGAGISTSAGIPDFRSPGSGIYDKLVLQKYKITDPQMIFELSYFNENPKPFFEIAKELYPGSFKPTLCHYFIRLLAEKGLLLRHYTQNIDTLERVAGLPSDKIVEAHGTFYTGHCLKCRAVYSLEYMKEKIFADKIPKCQKSSCDGVVKPDIVFFGENLPDRFYSCMDEDFNNCDLLIIMGSTLTVQPFASLVDRVPAQCPRLLINREKVGQCTGIMAMFGLGTGLNFDKKNTKDVFWAGDCDDGCQLLADKLDFGDELKELIKNEHKRIDDENSSTGDGEKKKPSTSKSKKE